MTTALQRWQVEARRLLNAGDEEMERSIQQRAPSKEIPALALAFENHVQSYYSFKGAAAGRALAEVLG
jgi:hypothetical protein